MRSVNKVILVGNLTRDPELKTTSSGQSIVGFGMATNRSWKTSTGEQRNSAEFHEVVAWAKLAEICKSYLKKGMLVYVEGYLKTRSWDMEDGTRRFRTEIVANDVIMLEKRKDGEDGDYDMEESSSSMGGDDGYSSDDDSNAGDDSAASDDKGSDDDGKLEASLDDDDMF